MTQQTVTLNPGESKVISFQVKPTMAKTYSVLIDGLSGSFKVLQQITLELDFLRVLGVEGIAFSSAGKKTITTEFDWELFAENMGYYDGKEGRPLNGFVKMVDDMDALVSCMRQKIYPGFPWYATITGSVTPKTAAEAMSNCGKEHPEWLSTYGKTPPPPFGGYTPSYGGLFGNGPHKVGDTFENWQMKYSIVKLFTESTTGEYMIQYAGVWKISVWEAQGVPDIVGIGLTGPRSAPGLYIPAKPVPKPGTETVLMGVLPNPISVDKIRGVDIDCRILSLPYSGGTWHLYGQLVPVPAFSGAPMPPAFRGTSESFSSPTKVAVSIKDVWAEGFSTPGIYDGRVQLSIIRTDNYELPLGSFFIKNLLRVEA